MDSRRFDELARRCAQILSRRSLLGGSAAASLLAAVGLDGDALARRRRARSRRDRQEHRRDREPERKRLVRKSSGDRHGTPRAGRDVQAEACTPNGKPCGKTKQGKKLKSCSKCCSGFNITTRSKKKKCACRPDGAACTKAAQCCASVCDQRVCGALS